MANYVKWEQSGINSNVKPPINRGRDYVAKSATPYKQLLELDLPSDFSGKEAVLATQKGMEACYSGANDLPGILSDIGRGMTLKDSASYAKLAKMFDATNRDFTRANVAASLFQYSGEKPTKTLIDQILSNPAAFSASMYGPEYGVTPEGEKLAQERWNGLIGTIGDLRTGAKELGSSLLWGGATIASGFVSGALGFVGDNLGGAGAFLLNAVGCNKAAESCVNFFDWSTQWDNAMKGFGINTEGGLYKTSKFVGNTATGLAINGALNMAFPGSSAIIGAAYGPINNGLQTYCTQYRSTLRDLKKADGTLSSQDYQNASLNALGHGLISVGSAALTGKVMGSYDTPNLQTKDPLHDFIIPVARRAEASFKIQFGANVLRQSVDQNTLPGNREISFSEAVSHGIVGSTASVAFDTSAGLAKAWGKGIKQITGNNKTMAKVTEKAYNSIVSPIMNSRAGTIITSAKNKVVKTVQEMVGNCVDSTNCDWAGDRAKSIQSIILGK